MFAVIKTGGKQYRVAPGDKITVERLAGDAGAALAFDRVLMVGEGTEVEIGAPFVSGAKVSGEIARQTRGDKIIVFKKRRRQNSRRKNGHRQDLTVVHITEIAGLGRVAKADTAEAKPKKRVAKAEATEAAEPATEAKPKKRRATKKKAK